MQQAGKHTLGGWLLRTPAPARGLTCAVLALTLAAAALTGCGHSREGAGQTAALNETQAPKPISVAAGEGNAPAPTGENSAAGSENAPGGTEPKPAPVSAEDPVAEATVVLENYLAADLGHDGTEMAKYLGGSAAAQFRPDVQGQEDVIVRSKKVSGHTVQDPNTIHFTVAVGWSPADSEEVKSDTEKYVLKRTDQGWKIVSTPAYP